MSCKCCIINEISQHLLSNVACPWHSFVPRFEHSFLIKRWCWHASDEQLHWHWRNVKCLHSAEMAEILIFICFCIFLLFIITLLQLLKLSQIKECMAFKRKSWIAHPSGKKQKIVTICIMQRANPPKKMDCFLCDHVWLSWNRESNYTAF